MNNKLSKLAVGLVVALAFAGQVGANPLISFSPDTIQGTGIQGALNTSSGSFVSTNALTGNLSFTDAFDVTVTAPINFNYNFTALNAPSATYGITSRFLPSLLTTQLVSWQLYAVNSNNVISSTPSSTGFTAAQFSAAGSLNAGTYVLDINLVTGLSGLGGYQFSVSNVTPVPEPTEGALLLSGVGLLGFIAARRKSV